MVSIEQMCGEMHEISRTNKPDLQYEFIWVMKQIQRCYKMSAVGLMHESVPFYIGLKNEYEWTMDLFVAGYNILNADYIGIQPYLINKEKYKDPQFQLEISVLNSDGVKQCTRKMIFNDDNLNLPEGIIKNFVKRADIWADKFLKVDELKIAFKICIIDPNRILDEAAQLQHILKNSHNTLEKLWECIEYSDFKLIVGGREFYVHQAILATASPVFEAMFNSNMREHNEGKAFVEDVEPEIMDSLLRFIYGRKLDDLENSAEKLIEAAEKYQLDSLKLFCENEIARKLTVDNVYDTLMLADMYNACELRKKAIGFFNRQLRKLYAKADFKMSISSLPPNLQVDIISSLAHKLALGKNSFIKTYL